MKFLVYNTTSGSVIAEYDTPASQVSIQVPEGCDFYLGAPSGTTHIIDNEPVVIIPEPVPLTETEIINLLTRAVQSHLNATAKQRNYDNVDSATKYIGSNNLKWSAEGTALRDWAVEVWEYCYQVIDDVRAELRTIPTPPELIDELPVMVWPTV